jgi:hypothetical protein
MGFLHFQGSMATKVSKIPVNLWLARKKNQVETIFVLTRKKIALI